MQRSVPLGSIHVSSSLASPVDDEDLKPNGEEDAETLCCRWCPHSVGMLLRQPRTLLCFLVFLFLCVLFLSLSLARARFESDSLLFSNTHTLQIQTERVRQQEEQKKRVEWMEAEKRERWKLRPDNGRETLEQRPINDTAAAATTTLTMTTTDPINKIISSPFTPMSPVDPMSSYTSCHNSRQGLKLVTDDSGSLCARAHMLNNGCCKTQNRIQQLSCSACRTDVQCCRSYEYCVSCCLNQLPSSDRAPDSVGGASTSMYGSSSRFSFHSFDRCLHLCRTSSRSIRHGNSYKTPVLRYCYTEGEHALPIDFEKEAKLVVGKRGQNCHRACASYGVVSAAAAAAAAATQSDEDAQNEIETPTHILPPHVPPPLYICHEPFLPTVNTCSYMQQHFSCSGDQCETNAGGDQPALVLAAGETQPDSTPGTKPKGQCLLNGDAKLFDCEGHHESTRRLCPCIRADMAE